MPFRSKRQWRWAFANKKKFARRWARNTKKSRKGGYSSLPAKKRRKKR